MKRKKTSKKRSSKSKKKETPEKEPEMVHLEVSEELTKAPEPKEPQKDNGGATKFLLIAALLIAVAVLAYYFILQPKDQFIPGAVVDETTFLNNFDAAQKVYIVMDVRDIDDDLLRKNVLQCGVDFAGSSGVAPKNATYFSLGDAGCVTVDGPRTAEYCFSEIRKGMAIYVHEGNTFAYYSNGISVGVNKSYELGTCGIHRA
jgi:hypothetical protein